MPEVTLYLGDCLEKLPLVETASVDAVITDSPYPCIKRKYGYWTVEQWWALIVEGVVPEVRRILKPTGSAVFILQPNSEHVGQMRGWLWEFMAWVCREWNMVQDVWWWNYTMMPSGVCVPRNRGLTRESLHACVWCGNPSCFRNQDGVLWLESDYTTARRLAGRAGRIKRYTNESGSGHHPDRHRIYDASEKRGGTIPFNVLPISNASPYNSAGAHGHGAGTPLKLADWWTRYICPPGGTCCDPFCGSGTMGVAAVNNGCNFIGIEKLNELGYFPTAQKRIAEAQEKAREPQQAGMAL